MKTDILMNGSMVKNHISLKTGFGYNATRRTSFLSWFHPRLVNEFFLDIFIILTDTYKTGESFFFFIFFILTFFTLVDDRSGKPEEIQANKIPKPNKKETTIERRNPCGDSEISEWLQEFSENLVDDEIPLQGGSHASSSHEVSSEPTTKRREDLGKHSVCTHFPKDRNCEICKRTKITRAPCRRRNGEASRTSSCKFW